MNLPIVAHLLTSKEEIEEIVPLLKGSIVSFDLETTSKDDMVADIVGIALATSAQTGWYIPVSHTIGPNVALADVLAILAPVLEDESVPKIGQNLKYDTKILRRNGVAVAGIVWDTMLAQYCIDPESERGFDYMAKHYLKHTTIKYKDVVPKKKTFADVPLKDAAAYAVEDAALIFEIAEAQHLGEQQKVFEEIDMPLMGVLMQMELNGIKLDTDYLNDLSRTWALESTMLLNDIYRVTGPFNVNSPKQLQEVLFFQLKLPKGRKTKTGYSTDTKVLENLKDKHEIADMLLRYRKLTKMLTTYTEKFPRLVNPESGRLHGRFNQTGTATNRLSSSKPNLQNIPSRGEEGDIIRRAFIAEEGNVLVGADYSQIELRVFAHFSQDAYLLNAYKQGEDIHEATARKIFDVASPTKDQRSAAKTINFGILYGMFYKKLAATLNISEQEGKELLENFFAAFPGVTSFIKAVKKDTKKKGYAQTMFGHRRLLPNIKSDNNYEVMRAERQAVSQVVQGSAADIIKIAMLRIAASLPPEAKMILQVHDEIVLECPAQMADAVQSILSREMSLAVKLDVPLIAEASIGKTWKDIK